MKKRFNKILSIFCIVALLLSVVNVGFFITASSAVQNNVVLSSDSNNSYIARFGGNLLAGGSVETAFVKDGGTGTVSHSAAAVTLTDGITTYGSQIQVGNTWNNNYAFSNATANTYTQLTFTASGTIDNPAKFLIAHAPAGRQTESVLYAKWYSIYASASKDTLYESANLVYEYKDANAGVEQIIDISDKNLTGIKYFGIRYYYTGQAGCILLPSEIALYAERQTVKNNSSYSVGSDGSYASNKELGANVLAGATVTSNYTYLGEDKGAFSCASYSNIANLTDGKTDAFVTYQASGWVNGYTPTTETYIDIDLALPTAASNIEEFLMAFPNSNGNTPSGWYEVYMTATESELDTASPVITWKDLNNTQQEQIFDISNKNLTGIKYVRVRLYDLDFAVICKINEIAMFCGRTVSATNSTTFTDDSNNSYTSVYGKNMLAGATVTTKAVKGGSETTVSHNADASILTDGTTLARNQIQADMGWDNSYSLSKASENTYIDVTFATAAPLNNIETFLIAHERADLESTLSSGSQWYSIYAAKTEAELNTADPIFTYKSQTQGIEQVIDLVPANLSNIKYFRIRYYHIAQYACILVPSEIALYGRNVTVTTGGFTSDANGSYGSVYGANLLASATLASQVVDGTDSGNTFKAAGQWGTPTHSFLTDNANGSINQIQTTAKIGEAGDYEQSDEYVKMLFTANTPLNNIEKMLIVWDSPSRVTNNNTGVTGTSMHYAIFASDSMDTLYDKPVFEYQSSTRQGNEHIIDLSEAKLANVKYIELRVYEMSLWGTCITLGEIGLYGSGIAPEIINSHKSATLEAQYGVNRLAESSFTGFETTDNGTTKQNITSGISGRLVNGQADMNMVTYNFSDQSKCLLNANNNGIDQTDAYIQIDFAINGEVKNPEKVLFSFHEGTDTTISSQHYAFFASDSADDLYSDENKIYEYKSSTGAGQGVEHVYDISALNLESVKFFGVRYYHRGYQGHVQHNGEIALYGGEFIFDTSKVHQVKVSHDSLSELGQNYLRWEGVTARSVNATRSVDKDSVNSTLTDSNASTLHMFAGDSSVLTAENNSNTQKDAFIEMTFDLCGTLNDPAKFIIDFHEGDNSAISSQHYEVFASNSKDTLYSSENSLYEYTSSTGAGEGVQHQLRLDHLDLTGLTYFGIRIYHRGYQNYVQHIADIGLYGNSDTTFVGDPQKLMLSVKANHTTSGWVGTYGTNYFADASGDVIASNGSSEVTLYEYTPVHLTEDAFKENSFNSDLFNEANNSVDQTDAYIQITRSLNGVIDDPEKFAIAFHEGNDQTISSKHYAIFASADEADLYDEANKVFEYKGESRGVEHFVDLSGLQLKGIKHFGIRIYHRGYNNTTQHLSELGLFGGKFTKEDAIESIETSGTISGENLAPYANIFASAYKNGEYLGDIMADFTAIVDSNEETGVVINHADMPQDDTTLGNGADGKDSYYTLDFYLRYNTKIDSIRLVNADKKDDRTYRYEFYVSTQISNLYDRANLVFQGHEGDGIVDEQYINSAGNQVQVFNFKEDAVLGKYFGIKVYETGNGASVSQVEVLDVELVGTEQPYTVSSGVHYTESEYNALGENLVLGEQPFRVRNNGTVQDTFRDDCAAMTNGKLGYSIGIGEYKDTGAFDIMYVIDSETPYTISKFFLSGIANPKNWNEQWFTGKYEVYASIKLDDLFAAENKVYDYDWERDGLSRWQIVNFDKEVNACYIAIRVINSVAYNEDQKGVRFEEFGVYGKVADIDYQDTNLASYLPVTAYLTDSNGTILEVSDKDFTVNESVYISDSDETTVADFTTDGKTLDLVFNLCNDAEISKIKVLAESSKLSYNVYAASDIGQVWDNSSLIGTYNGSDTPFAVAENEELLNARYIRVSFAATNGNKVTVKDIQVIGLENQLLNHKAISRTLDGNKASVFERDLKTNELTYDNFKDGGVLFDSDYFGAAMTNVGVQGVSSANVMVNLDGLKNVDEISVYFTRHMTRNQPLELKVYISNTYEGAMDFSAEPVASFTGLPKEGKYTVSFKPQLARYIRIEVTKNNWDAKTGEGDYINKENMLLAFSEIEVFGTKVVGMQTDFERDDIMSFTDKETGITWEIVRVDESDIITSVYSSKLVKYKASNWQKTSLNQSPYYKVVGDNVYGFEFYDFFGNKVESIDGRKLRVKIPVDEAMLDGGAALGDASDPTTIEMLETTDGDGYVYTSFVYSADSKIALLQATSGDDEYWSTIGELENFEGTKKDDDDKNDSSSNSDFNLDLDDSSDFLGDSEVNEQTPQQTSKTKITKKITNTVSPLWLFILDGALVLLLLAAITFIIIIGVKRRKEKKANLISE